MSTPIFGRAPGAVVLLAVLAASLPANAGRVGCSATAQFAFLACRAGAHDDFFTDRAKCLDTLNADKQQCFSDAADALGEVMEECDAVYAARLDVCEVLNDAPHQPQFGEDFADNFVDPLQIGSSVAANPWFPLTQGNRWVLEGTFEDDGEEVTEVITIEVTDKTKLIDGITCLVVSDIVTIDDELVEDTNDWFAQDVDGNVWYCGEEVRDFEHFDGDEPPLPELTSNDGTFKAGRDGEKGGVLLPFAPVVGAVIRQEVVWSDAEDIIEILSLAGTESSPAASCAASCLVTRDFSPLDPGVEENKYYVSGVGKILEINLENGARFELVEYTVNQQPVQE